VVSSARADLSVELHLHPSDGTAPAEEELLPAGDRVYARRDAAEPALPPGDHQVFAAANGTVLAQRKMRLVASDTPRVSAAALGYSLNGQSAWRAVSAEPDAGDHAVRGAAWEALTAVAPPLASVPPVSLGPMLRAEDQSSGGRARQQRAADIRPEKHRRERRKRRAKITKVSSAGILDKYLGHIQDAVEREEEGFTAPDGRAWWIKYYDNGDIVVRPRDALVPFGRYSVKYTIRATARGRG
jgi:hypothetical protein